DEPQTGASSSKGDLNLPANLDGASSRFWRQVRTSPDTWASLGKGFAGEFLPLCRLRVAVVAREHLVHGRLRGHHDLDHGARVVIEGAQPGLPFQDAQDP